MRISDWSSDVCSSDLTPAAPPSAATVWLRIGYTFDTSATRNLGSLCATAMAARNPAPPAPTITTSVCTVCMIRPARRDSAIPGRNRRASTPCLHIRSEEHTSELQSLMRISYAVFCLKKKNKQQTHYTTTLDIPHP